MAAAGRSNADGLHDELVGRARDLVPVLRERAAIPDRIRTIPRETHEAFTDAGFYRILQPARYGGHETGLATLIDIAAELGRGCGSSAWVFTNLVMQSWINGRKDQRAQEELWADDPDVHTASSFPGREAVVREVDGGFAVSGEWHYSSGIDFASWNNLQLFLTPENGPPCIAFAGVPESDYEAIDDWDMTGLRGTGSRSLRVDGAFIPEYRVHRIEDDKALNTPGGRINPGTIYRLPFWGIGARAFSAPAIGLARGMMDHVVEDLRGRIGARGGVVLAEQPTVQARIAESGAEIDAAWSMLLKDSADAAAIAEAGRLADLETRTRWRRNNSYAVQLCLRAADRLYALAGMRAMEPESPIARIWRDIRAAASQVGTAWDPQATNYGKALFGLPLSDPRARG
ncbi:MAG: acyl-CoA dehydrogenase family protein [Defluviicoccus sp.]|nr:acyl-CoA dehydrogenase family protein [Defluviicoccus sp.]MDE0383308.1 acyl-CoA dehydrogenase family protein [Defluviicoccus sp.]